MGGCPAVPEPRPAWGRRGCPGSAVGTARVSPGPPAGQRGLAGPRSGEGPGTPPGPAEARSGAGVFSPGIGETEWLNAPPPRSTSEQALTPGQLHRNLRPPPHPPPRAEAGPAALTAALPAGRAHQHLRPPPRDGRGGPAATTSTAPAQQRAARPPQPHHGAAPPGSATAGNGQAKNRTSGTDRRGAAPLRRRGVVPPRLPRAGPAPSPHCRARGVSASPRPAESSSSGNKRRRGRARPPARRHHAAPGVCGGRRYDQGTGLSAAPPACALPGTANALRPCGRTGRNSAPAGAGGGVGPNGACLGGAPEAAPVGGAEGERGGGGGGVVGAVRVLPRWG